MGTSIAALVPSLTLRHTRLRPLASLAENTLAILPPHNAYRDCGSCGAAGNRCLAGTVEQLHPEMWFES